MQVCCIFQPANGCSARCLLVKTAIFPKNKIQQKTPEKGLFSSFWELLPKAGRNIQFCNFTICRQRQNSNLIKIKLE